MAGLVGRSVGSNQVPSESPKWQRLALSLTAQRLELVPSAGKDRVMTPGSFGDAVLVSHPWRSLPHSCGAPVARTQLPLSFLPSTAQASLVLSDTCGWSTNWPRNYGCHPTPQFADMCNGE